jgi:glycosyltransferase involved in cell wall biosynthesis
MYNAGPYLERCLRSLEAQDISRDDYEIICINDGSIDNTVEVVRRLQSEFENIILHNQENMGVSLARNHGIDLAKGKYLMMVDPDDYSKSNILKKRLELMDYYDLDIGIASYIILDKYLREEYRFDPHFDSQNVLSGIDYFDKYLRGKSEIRDPHRSWAIFLKTSFLNTNGLRYLDKVPYLEDGELMARVICLARKVSFFNGPIYMRTTITGSATQSNLYFSEKARNGFLKAANNLLSFKLNCCKREEQKVFLNQEIVHFTILYLISIGSFNYLKYYSEIVDNLKKGPLKKLDTAGCSDFYQKMAKYYNFSIHYFYMNWIYLRVLRSIETRVTKISLL